MVLARKHAILFASLSGLVLAYPIRREVPQEHSHNAILNAVRTTLNLNNPDGIVDPVFGLLGNAAAAAGQGKISNTDCLQQATADQAFTNAKAANDVAGMVSALQFRGLERNTGRVGLASVACTAIKAVNPEIAAISQHQDPASDGAAAINKAIVLELAKQIASVGGDPQLALATGTFKPGDVNDATGKGNTCDTADDTVGCIVSQNLLVEDATAAEIEAAVAGVAAGGDAAATSTGLGVVVGAVETDSCSLVAVTVTVTNSPAASATETSVAAATTTTAAPVTSAASTEVVTPPEATTSVAAATTTPKAAATTSTRTTSSAAAATTTATASTGGGGSAGTDLQPFTGSLGGSSPPAVTTSAKGFSVDGSEFVNLPDALNRSCDVQHNVCANAANAGGGFSVGECDKQNNDCKAAAST